MLLVAHEHTQSPLKGLRVGPYTILDTLQRGGMGEVVLAQKEEQDGSSSIVVVKRLLEDFIEDEKYEKMFRAEMEVMSRLRHPNIVKVLDLPTIDGKACMAMEYVQGANLHHVLRKCRKLDKKIPPQIALYAMAEVLRGLEYAHNFVLDDGGALELVHRDITPGNLLISFKGELKITDFGISKSRMSEHEATTIGTVKGTTRYLSPEQIRGENATPRSDLFSATIVLVEMLTNISLFERDCVPPTLFAILNGDRPKIASLLPPDAAKLAALIERGLSTNAKQRPQSAVAYRIELLAAASELGPPADSAALSSFIRQLFPQQAVSNSYDNLDLTYLVEVPEVVPLQAVAPPPIEDLVHDMVVGARPLDAATFGPLVPSDPSENPTVVPEISIVRKGSYSEIRPSRAREHSAAIPTGPSAAVMSRYGAPRRYEWVWLSALALSVAVAMFFFYRAHPKTVVHIPSAPRQPVTPLPILPIERVVVTPDEDEVVPPPQQQQTPVTNVVSEPPKKIKAPTERANGARASRRKTRAHRGH